MKARSCKALGRVAVVSWVAVVSFCLASCQKRVPEPIPTRPAETATITNSSAGPWFEEVAVRAGVLFHHRSGHRERFYFPEIETGGTGLLDYDGDGLLDIFCVDGGSLNPGATNPPGCKLFRNLGSWKFEDVTEKAGVAGHGEYGMGCACGDYNGDGRIDIYVTHLNGGILYQNTGEGRFLDVTRKAGLDSTSWGVSAAFLDYDGDGRLDLVVANYVRWSRETEMDCHSRGGALDYCSPVNYKAPSMVGLYRNLAGGKFENVTLSAGLDQAYGNGLGVVCADFDHDGRVDIFIANDAMPNQLWVNKGGGKFTDEALTRGCALNVLGIARAGMGVVAVDMQQTGWLDLFVTHLVSEGNGWFMNAGGYFTDRIAQNGPSTGSLPWTGFGVGFADFNQDGLLDVYVANGRVKYGARDLTPTDPYAEPNTLLCGLGGGVFQEVNPPGGTEPLLMATSRGAAFGDLDNDGAIDVVVVNKDGPLHLLRNISRPCGNWLQFRVLTRQGVDAINATVRLEAGGKMQFREVLPNQGYASSSDPRVHFGLGPVEKGDRVVVRWRAGEEEAFGPFTAGHNFELVEGTGRKVTGVFGF